MSYLAVIVISLALVTRSPVHPRQSKDGAAADESLIAGTIAGEGSMVDDALARGASVNARSKTGMTPLMWAAANGDDALVRRLLSAGADVSATSDFGLTPLAMAARAGRVSTMNLLLDAGAPVDQPAVLEGTALHWAAWEPQAEAVGVLLARGADVNARDQLGRSALMLAAAQHEAPVPTVRRLLAAGADANAVDQEGLTALMIAKSESQDDELLEVLLNAGALADRLASERSDYDQPVTVDDATAHDCSATGGCNALVNVPRGMGTIRDDDNRPPE